MISDCILISPEMGDADLGCCETVYYGVVLTVSMTSSQHFTTTVSHTHSESSLGSLGQIIKRQLERWDGGKKERSLHLARARHELKAPLLSLLIGLACRVGEFLSSNRSEQSDLRQAGIRTS